MKKFFDNIFKPYIFPIIILIIGAFLKTADNLKSVTLFFKDSTSKFLNFFNSQFYLWEVILYLIVIYIIRFIYNFFFNKISKKERIMLKAIKKSPDFTLIQVDNHHKFKVKFKASVKDENYKIVMTPYCNNCSNDFIRMTEGYLADFTCNCGSKLEYKVLRDVESRIITDLEKNE